MFSLPLLLTAYAGFTHAFETDHLLAVSNIISQRKNFRLSLKDGIFWGLGHASTILLMGVLIMICKASIPGNFFLYFEAVVGAVLIILGICRLAKYLVSKPGLTQVISRERIDQKHLHHHKTYNHTLAYGIGLVHGLAGSGAIILLVLSQMKGSLEGLIFLVIFGVGCILGMLFAAGLFSIPFSKKMIQAKQLQLFLVVASSVLCIIIGSKVIFENLHLII